MKNSPSWRDIARPLIFRVLMENKDKPEAEIRKALKDAFPFGERRYHPYKVWLNEIGRQRKGHKKNNQKPVPKEQLALFYDGINS